METRQTYMMGTLTIRIRSGDWTRFRDITGNQWLAMWTMDEFLFLARLDNLYFLRKSQKNLLNLKDIGKRYVPEVEYVSKYFSWVTSVQGKEIEAGSASDPCGSGQGRGTIGEPSPKTGKSREVPKEKISRWATTLQQAKGISLASPMGSAIEQTVVSRYLSLVIHRRPRRNSALRVNRKEG